MTNCIHSKDLTVFRWRQSSDVLFGALVNASGRAELDGITNQSIDPDPVRAGLAFLRRPPPIY